jgi:5-methylcytosine-specific restriction endonuclease McrA
MKSKFANNGSTSPAKRLTQKRYDLKSNYGLSIAEADYLRANMCCEICGDKAKKMVIDHKIKGTYRGILCQQCNTRLGWVEKNINTILDYIERGPQNAVNKVNK